MLTGAAILLVLLAAAVPVIVSAGLVLVQYEYRRFTRSQLGEDARRGDWQTPRVTLIVPVKGDDPGLAGNLERLFQQEYPDYAIVFVVEDRGEPAVAVIEELSTRHRSIPAEIRVAGRAAGVGQKVHNLIQATRRLDDRTGVVAFVDADARPCSSWLRTLVQAHENPRIGASTGYRWLIPQRRTLPNLLVASANSAAAALCGRHSRNMIWGGSWAIRRDLFESCGIADAWRGKLTEDLVATAALKRSGYRVGFQPGCLCASPLDLDWRGAFAFVRRQFFLVRVYTPRLWLGSVVCTSVLQAGFWGSAAAAIGLAAAAEPLWLVPAASWLLQAALGVARGWLRQDAARHCLGEALDGRELERWFDIFASPLSSLFAWLALLASAYGRSTAWRGIRYRLDRSGRVVEVLRREQDERPVSDWGSGCSGSRRGFRRLPVGPKLWASSATE